MNEEVNKDIGGGRQNNTRRNLVVIILAVLCAAAMGVSIWAIWFRETEEPLVPDYAPQAIEPNVLPIEEDDTSKLDAPAGGGAISLTYSTEVTVDLSDKKARLVFGNPAKSTQDIVLQIAIQEQVIVQSGRITPGNQVATLDLRSGAEKLLSPGGYDGKFVVLAYSPSSGEKAMVNTEIPLSVTVVE